MSEGQRQVLRRMQDSARRLNRMASAVLDLGINRQAKRRPKLQKTDIGDCLDRALREVAAFADEKALSITTDLQPPGNDLWLAPDLIEQALTHMLEMGCRFVPENGAIEIRGYPYLWERRVFQSSSPLRTDRRVRTVLEPNGYRFDIRDSGPPIGQEHLHTIFDEHTSYTGGRDRSSGGLGLAICKMIIAQHEGRIWAENTAEGPQFSFVLPLHRCDPGTGGDEEQPGNALDAALMSGRQNFDANG
jgi:signal transduction histidine kinase